MKKTLFILLLGLIQFPRIAYTQIDIMPFAGFNFGATMPVYGGQLRILSAATYGVNVDYNIGTGTAIQLSYTNALSTVRINDYLYPGGGQTNGEFSNISENYFLLGGVRYLSKGKLRPYINVDLGAVYYDFSQVADYYDKYAQTGETRFAFGFGLGLKVMFTDRVGIDLHVRGLAPVSWGGIGIGIGTSGVSPTASLGSTFISGDVGGGLIIRLGG